MHRSCAYKGKIGNGAENKAVIERSLFHQDPTENELLRSLRACVQLPVAEEWRCRDCYEFNRVDAFVFDAVIESQRGGPMPVVLIVDDSQVDRLLAGSKLEQLGFEVRYAHNGREALESIGIQLPDVVLTDLIMPEMDGLELVKQIKAKRISVPVVLMTAHGNEETAVNALRIGAANYVPKKNLVRDLEQTIDNVISVVMTKRAELQLLECLSYIEQRFVLANDITSIRPLIQHIQSQLRQMQIFDDNDIVRISTALQEAVVNAIEHGNLELRSDLRDSPDGIYSRLAKERMQLEPYKSRHVQVTIKLMRDQAEWLIRDEGPGYDPSSLPDPRDPENLQKVSGRGLLLIRTFMDEVNFNGTANEIRMLKRKVVRS